MQDTCKVLSYSAVDDAYNNPAPTYTPGSPTACGLEHVHPDELQGTGEVPVIDARLRLPIATTVKETDRIQLTHRYGEALSTPQDFEIVGPVKRGPSGLVLELRRVTDA